MGVIAKFPGGLYGGEGGVYVYENFKKTEVCNNDVGDPFCHVIWNSTGKLVFI